MANLNRREFLLGSAGVAFSFALPVNGVINSAFAKSAGKEKSLSAWARIATDGTITIMSPASELGQGSMTAVPAMFAEELDANWDDVVIEFSPANDEIFKNPIPWTHGVMMTLGSISVAGYHDSVRLYGAQVRKVLIDAAAKKLDVPASELTTEPSLVVHKKSGRRLSYGNIASFIEVPSQLPEVSKSDLKRADQFRIMGKNIPRYDIPPKVRGGAVYSIDVDLPGMVYATVNRAPVHGASPLAVENESAVRAMPNVLKVVKLEDAVAVVAKTYEAAFKAEKALKVKWSQVEKLAGYNQDKGLSAHMSAVKDMNARGMPWQMEGDVNQAVQQAAKVYESEYQTEYHYHAQLEPLNSVAHVKDNGKSVEIWAGTQTPTHCTRSVAAALEIPVEKVQLHRTMLGGAFGRRAAQDHDFVVDAVLLSKNVGKPVKVIWSRETDVKAGRFKPITAHYLRAAEDENGELVAWHHRVASDEPHKQADPYRYGKNRGWPVISGNGIIIQYSVKNIITEVIGQDTGVRISPLRGIGYTLNKFAAESFIDEIAEQKDIDPLEFRLSLLKHHEKAVNVLKTVAKMSNWSSHKPTDGLGIAFGEAGGTYFGIVAQVKVNKSTGVVRVPKVWVAMDVGYAVHPDNINAQMQSGVTYAISNTIKERITFSNGVVDQNNFYDYQVLRIDEAPDIEIEVISQNDSAPGGVGDTSPAIVPAAIANAFARATGKRARHMPLTPDNVKAVLKA